MMSKPKGGRSLKHPSEAEGQTLSSRRQTLEGASQNPDRGEGPKLQTSERQIANGSSTTGKGPRIGSGLRTARAAARRRKGGKAAGGRRLDRGGGRLEQPR